MTTIGYQNPGTTNLILESVQTAGGGTPTNSETVVQRGDPTGTVGGLCFHWVAQTGLNEVSIKSAAGTVYGIHVYNNAYYPISVKLYNKVSQPNPQAEQSLLVRTITVQAGTQRDVIILIGHAFSAGIAMAITQQLPDNDASPIYANDCEVDIDYA